MTLAQIANIADLLAAFGVIASLLVVAYEIRRNTNEAKKTNFESLIDRFITLWSRTDGADLPDILNRGRKDYIGLTDRDQIIFGNYHQELCLTYEALLVFGLNQVHGDKISELPLKHLRYHFGFPGAQQWWIEFSSNRGLAPIISQAVENAIKDVSKSSA